MFYGGCGVFDAKSKGEKEDTGNSFSVRTGLLVEDHADACQWLVGVLAAAFPGIKFEAVDCLEAARAALAWCAEAKTLPDLALIDLGLPDGSGIELIKELREQAPHCICVVASRHEDDDHLFAALRAGASGYLLKQRPQEELVRLLRGIVRGEPPVAPALVSRLLASFGPDVPAESAPAIALTERENEVLVQLVKGLTLAQIGDMLCVSRHTVASHVKQIYAKLEVSSRAEATMEAVRLQMVKP